MRFNHQPSDVERLVEEAHFDRIRDYARLGENYDHWPYHERRIFPTDTLMRHPRTSEWVQAGFGYDLFVTRRRETFFAFLLYGVEWVINLGGPSIKGYEEWLSDYRGISPLIERVGARLIVQDLDGVEHFCLTDPDHFHNSLDFDRAALGNAGRDIVGPGVSR